MAVRGTGFTDIGQYLSGNAGTLANERAQLSGTVGDELDAAKGAADKVLGQATPGGDYTAIPGYGDALQQQTQAEQDASNLGSNGGLQDLLQRTRGDSSDQGAFDAQLLTGAPQLGAVQQRAATMGDYLDQQGQQIYNTPPPPTTPPPAAPPPPDPRDPEQPYKPGNPASGPTHPGAPYAPGVPTYPPRRKPGDVL